jgi:hypothetical protein
MLFAPLAVRTLYILPVLWFLQVTRWSELATKEKPTACIILPMHPTNLCNACCPHKYWRGYTGYRFGPAGYIALYFYREFLLHN